MDLHVEPLLIVQTFDAAIPDEAITGVASWAPTLLNALALAIATSAVLYAAISITIRTPSWLNPFVEEPKPSEDFEEDDEHTQNLPYSTLFIGFLSFSGLVIQLVSVVWVPWQVIPTLSWTGACLALLVAKPRTAPTILVSFYAVQVAAHVFMVLAKGSDAFQSIADIFNTTNAGLAFVAAVVAVNMPLRDRRLSSSDISKANTVPDSALRSPEDNITLWQWMSISWMGAMINVGSKRKLNDADVWSLGYEFQHHHLHHAFRDLNGTVMRRLLKANWVDLVILTILAFVELAANFVQPLLLQQLLRAMRVLDVTYQPAIIFGAITLVASLIATQSTIFSLWYGRRCYERSRGEMVLMLYEKTLTRKMVSGIQADEPKEGDAAKDALPDTTEGVEESMNNIVNSDNEPTEDTPLLNGNANDHAKLKKEVPGRLQRFKKILFSRTAKKEPDKKMPASMGKIINMFRNDAYDVAQRFWDFQTLIKRPVGIILALVLSWRLIGWAIVVGIVIVIVAQVLNALLARLMVTWEKTRRKATDDRLQRTSQFIEALRHLRWYGWQATWLVGIMEARDRELKQRVINMCLRMSINITSIIASGLLPVASFYGYTKLAGQELTVDIAFPALALFDMLQNELRGLPQLITGWLNAMVAVSRLEDFMKEPNMDEFMSSEISVNGTGHPEPSTDLARVRSSPDVLEIRSATFAWPGATEPVLKNITLSFKTGLNVVVGEVGSGKSALLQALLGELDLKEGELLKTAKPIGYCAQTPWLQSMSIRDNILFSAPYDHNRYQETIEVCALKSDFANFTDGDLSEIGENGIGLSGGQRARVALARAIYSRTDYLLLDDPLSALDQQTAEWVTRKCLTGRLVQGRTVVLITHRTDLCRGLEEQTIEIANHTATITHRDLISFATKDHHSSEETPTTEKAPDSETPEATKFMEEEKREAGGIQWPIYWQFVRAGGLWTWIVLLIVDVAFHALVFVRNWFLKEWGEAYSEPQKSTTYSVSSFEASTPLSRFFNRFPNPAENPNPWLVGLTVIALVQSASWFSDQLVMVVLIYTTGKKMFRLLINRVTNAVFRFYDVTPVGRLMNRMTSDIGAIDGSISGTLSNFLFFGASWAINIFVLAGTTPSYLIAAVFLVVGFVSIFMRFLPTSQSLRRLETVSLSPLMSNFGALVEGLTTVRAYCAQTRFLDSAIKSTDTFQKMDHFYWSLQAWLQWRFQLLSAASTFLMTLLAIFTGVTPGLTAFVLRAAGRLVQTTHQLCMEYGRLQMDFVSVERVVELFHVEQEPKGSIDPPADWPSFSSDVVFEDVVIRYAPHLAPALSGISFTLPAGSTTAVIGRTGSGKSTLALALLGTVLPESGRILIGGLPIADVDKQTLRSRISFLAQDPVLFPGSMRKNLDPTLEHTDEECAAVLSRVCGRFGWTLEMEIDAGGKNLSQGQRQLVGLCRAILRRSALIIMDEATASIDKESAWEIQRVLRQELKQSTVLTIAHRHEAVRGADWVLELGKGKVVEMRRLAGEGSADQALIDVDGRS